MRRRLWLIVVTVVMTIAGCASSPPSESPEPAASAAADAEVCPKNPLRMPNGETLRLTGHWLGNDFGDYYISQRESCLYWLGQSAALGGNPSGYWWTNVFTGRLHTDFTVDGPWGDVPFLADHLANGEMTMKIDFFEVGDATWPTFHLVEQSGGETFGGSDWVPVDSLTERTVFVGTYGFQEPDCPWIDVNGQRYEIVEWQYDLASGGQLMGEGDETMVRPGDQIRVEAQVSAPLGITHCQAGSMLVWDLQPEP